MQTILTFQDQTSHMYTFRKMVPDTMMLSMEVE